MSLLDLIAEPDPSFLGRDYFVLIESHLEYLRNHSKNRILEVTPHEADVYRGDLAGLLRDKQISKATHYAIIRMNGFESSMAYDGVATHFIIPDDSVVSKIMSSYSSQEA